MINMDGHGRARLREWIMDICKKGRCEEQKLGMIVLGEMGGGHVACGTMVRDTGALN